MWVLIVLTIRLFKALYPSCSACLTNITKCVYMPANTESQLLDISNRDSSLGWATPSPARPLNTELARNTENSHSTMPSYNFNSSLESWNLGLEPRFFPQQEIQSSSDFLNN